jgi:hypothetical protein
MRSKSRVQGCRFLTSLALRILLPPAVAAIERITVWDRSSRAPEESGREELRWDGMGWR